MKHKFGLLPKVLLAIALGIVFGLFVPEWFTRIALTFNNIFGNFLNFVIPLLILGLVAPGIADLGSKAGRLLVITAALAYAFTLFSGFGTFFTSFGILPRLLGGTEMSAPGETAATPLQPFFTVEMPPLMSVMTALILAFVLGLGMAYIHSDKLKGMMDDFKLIIERVISKVIIPLLPFYIFGIFLSMTQSGQVSGILGIFLKLIVIIFVMTVVLLLIQFSIAGLVARQNPLKMLRTMMTAYMTALGTQSSAATIPRDGGTDGQNRRPPRSGGIRRPAVRHDPPLGLDDEDRRLLARGDDALRAGRFDGYLLGFHPAAGHHDDRRTGRTGRSHHGCDRIAGVDARVRRKYDRTDDRHLHCHGQFRNGDQRNGRRCDRGDRKRHRQPNGSRGKTINLLLIFSHSKKIFNFASIVHKRTTAVK